MANGKLMISYRIKLSSATTLSDFSLFSDDVIENEDHDNKLTEVDLQVEGSSSNGTPRDPPNGKLIVGSQFTFQISILQATGIPPTYEDVYCQFRCENQFK